MFGLKWGVVGAALAPAIGQYVGLAVMVGLLIKEKALFAEDLSSIPTLKEVTPLLQVSSHCCRVACRTFPMTLINDSHTPHTLGCCVTASDLHLPTIILDFPRLCAH